MSGKRAVALLSGVVCLLVFIASSSGQLQNAPWPMYGHDYRHTGESGTCSIPDEDPTLGWSYATGSDTAGFPIVDRNGITYVGSDDNVLYAIMSAGVLLWSYEIAGDISSSPAISASDVVYAGSEDSQFYALNTTGVLEWSYRTGGALESSPAIDTSGYVYIGSNDNNIYVFTSAGMLSWSYLQGDQEPSSPAIGSGGEAYIGALDNRLYVYDSVGMLSWSYLTDGDVRSSPMVDASGYAYVGSNDNNLYALTSGGAIEWSYAFPAESSTPFRMTTGRNGIFAASRGDTIYVYWRKGWWWYECHFHANGSIVGGPSVRGNYIVFTTATKLYVIAPTCNPFTEHCVLIKQFDIWWGGHIIFGPHGWIIVYNGIIFWWWWCWCWCWCWWCWWWHWCWCWCWWF